MSNEKRPQSIWASKKLHMSYGIPLLLLIIFVVVWSVVKGNVSKVGIPGVMDIEFQSRPLATEEQIEKLSKNERVEHQEELKRRLKEVEDTIKRRGEANRAQYLNVDGTWQGAGGLSYIIRQSGSFISIQEINPFYGVTAVGQGVINQQDMDISYTTVLGLMGRVSLKVSADGREITGTFTNPFTGMLQPIVLYR